MRIGNDVVDLSDPETRREALHPRFDDRVFTVSEAETIGSSARAHRMRWACWAAKESAYKVAKKLDTTTVFSPARFVVALDQKGTGVVAHRDKRFSVRIHHSKQYVHAIALPLPTGLNASGFCLSSTRRYAWKKSFAGRGRPEVFLYGHARVNRTIKNRPDELSLFARQQAKRAIGPLLGIGPDRIEISSDEGIPRVRSGRFDLPVDLSLSHHGCYVAFAICYLMPISSTSKTNIPCGAPGRP